MKFNWNLFSLFKKKKEIQQTPIVVTEEDLPEVSNYNTSEPSDRIRQRRKEFLDDLVQYYGYDTRRRSTKGQSCFYRLGKRKCAIGRHISDQDYHISLENRSVSNSTIFESLPRNIQELGVEFLGSIQNLHDVGRNWNKRSGLSKIGKDTVEEIRSSSC